MIDKLYSCFETAMTLLCDLGCSVKYVYYPLFIFMRAIYRLDRPTVFDEFFAYGKSTRMKYIDGEWVRGFADEDESEFDRFLEWNANDLMVFTPCLIALGAFVIFGIKLLLSNCGVI